MSYFQFLWDRALLRGYIADLNLYHVYYDFSKQVKLLKNNEIQFEKLIKLLNENKIKRTPRLNDKLESTKNIKIREAVYLCCPRLSEIILSDKYTFNQILGGMKKVKWKKVNIKPDMSHKRKAKYQRLRLQRISKERDRAASWRHTK